MKTQLANRQLLNYLSKFNMILKKKKSKFNIGILIGNK